MLAGTQQLSRVSLKPEFDWGNMLDLHSNSGIFLHNMSHVTLKLDLLILFGPYSTVEALPFSNLCTGVKGDTHHSRTCG